MDHDIMGSHVQRLLEFKKRIEELLEGLATPAAPPSDSRVDDLVKDVAGVKAWMDGATPILSGLKDMTDWFAANRDGLEAILSLGDDLKPAIEGTVISSTTATQPEPAAVEQPAPAADPAAVDQPKPAPDAPTAT